MKILVCTDALGFGGAETHVLSLVAQLSEMGHCVTLAAPHGSLEDALPQTVRFALLPPFERSPLGLIRSRCALRRVIGRCEGTGGLDVIHAHARLPALLLHGLARHKKLPLVVTAHAMFRMTPPLRRLSRWGVRTIAVSEDIKQMLVARGGVDEDRITVIPNGIDTSRFSPDEGAAPVRENFPRIIFVSRLDRDCSSAAAMLCRICGRLRGEFPSVSITIVGGGECCGEISALAELMNTACGDEVVKMVGAVSDVERYLRQSDIFVGVSRAAMEAAACGLPVILAGDEGYGGIWQPADGPDGANLCARGQFGTLSVTLFDDICRLAHMDAHQLAELGRRGREFILKFHSAAGCAAQTLTVLREACAANNARRKMLRVRRQTTDESAVQQKNTVESAGTGAFQPEGVEKTAQSAAFQPENAEKSVQTAAFQPENTEKSAKSAALPCPVPVKKPQKANRRAARHKPQTVICGGMGGGNPGFDAAADVLISSLCRAGVDSRDICMITPHPRRAAQRFGVHCISRVNRAAVGRALRTARLLLLGGGSLIHSQPGLAYYRRLAARAVRCGCGVMVWGAGLGPLYGETARRQAALLLHGAGEVLLREPLALDIAHSLGVRLDGGAVYADPALLTRPCPESRVAELLGGDKTAYFAVALRDQPNGRLQGSHFASNFGLNPALSATGGTYSTAASEARHRLMRYASALDGIAQVCGARAVFLIMSPEDRRITAAVRRHMEHPGIVLDCLTPCEIVGVLGHCRVAVGMRLHLLEFGFAAGIPTVAVGNTPDILGFMSYAGLAAPLPATLNAPAQLVSLAASAALRQSRPESGRRAELLRLAEEGVARVTAAVAAAK